MLLFGSRICGPVKNFQQSMCYMCRSGWPRGLRFGSAAAQLLGLWVRIPLEAWMLLCVVRYRSLRRAHHSSRGVLPSVVRQMSVKAKLRKGWPWPGIGSKRNRETQLYVETLIPWDKVRVEQWQENYDPSRKWLILQTIPTKKRFFKKR
jgi:hypothetical protein